MNKDRLDKGLREKLGNARIEPPSQMWERIAATLQEQGLTASGTDTGQAAADGKGMGMTAIPKFTPKSGRVRRLLAGYAAAAVVLAAALMFYLRQPETTLLTDNVPAMAAATTAEADAGTNPETGAGTDARVNTDAYTGTAVTADDLAAAMTPRIARRTGETAHTRKTAAETGIVIAAASADPASEHVRPHEFTTESGRVHEFTTEPGRVHESATESVNSREPSIEPVRQWADRDEIERALKSDAGKRNGDMSLGLYSSNIGNRSSERVVQSGPYAKVTSSFVAQESANAAFNSSRQTATSTVLKHRVPLSAGVSVTKRLAGRFSLESGMTYSYLASKGESLLSGGTNSIKKRELHYLGVPVGIKYDMFRSRYVDLYASASGLFEMCVYSRDTRTMEINGVAGGSESSSLNVRGIQPSVGIRVGVEAKLSRTLGIYLEPGFSYYFDIEKQPESYRTENPFNFAFSAGLRINFR